MPRDEGDLRHGDELGGGLDDATGGGGDGLHEGDSGAGDLGGGFVALGALGLDSAGDGGGGRDGGCDGGDEGDGGGDVGADAWILGHKCRADAGEVAEGSLDFLVRGAPGGHAGDDVLGEFGVGAHAFGVAVGGALG